MSLSDEQDVHGCDPLQGEVWCAAEGRCVYEWNSSCLADQEPNYDSADSDAAATMAIAAVRNSSSFLQGIGRQLEVSNILSARCPGCWQVNLRYIADGAKTDKDRVTVQVTIDDWEITDIVEARSALAMMTVEECMDRGGRPVDTVAGGTCRDDETDVGDVTDFISPTICCV